LGALTWQQTAIYRNLETLWRDTLAKNPDCWLAHNNLGIYLYREGHNEEAIEHYHKAIQINPHRFETFYSLGASLAAQGRLDEAIENYHKAIHLNPNYSYALNNLGMALAAKGQLDEAIRTYRQAVQVDPNSSEALNNLGVAFATKGQLVEAVQNFRKAIQINPNSSDALNNLAWALATSPDDRLRNGAKAVRLAEHACELTHYAQPLFIGTLAAAYAESHRFPEAVSAAEKAEQLAINNGMMSLAATTGQLLELYRAGKPYHEAAPTRQ